MLSKSATMLLGLITHQPLNAYEIVKTLDYMNIKYWFNIGTSTVYATIKTLEKKQYLVGEIQKDGNMPDNHGTRKSSIFGNFANFFFEVRL